jgi:hypothetical protein
MLMDPFFTLFEKSFREYNTSSLRKNHMEMITFSQPHVSQTIKLLEASKYIDVRIVKTLKKKLCWITKVSYMYDNTLVSLCIGHESKIQNVVHDEINNVLTLLNYYLVVLNKINHRKRIDITIHLVDIPKKIPARKTLKKLAAYDINSGYSSFGDYHHEILVYRKEEWTKVLLHEMVHCWDIMFHRYDPEIDKILMEKLGIIVERPLNVMNPLALYETFTDFFACYGHVITCALFKKNGDVKKLCRKEIQHIMRQGQKVWQFSRTESSHAFAYYVAKAAVFHRLEAYISLVNKNGLNATLQGDTYMNLLQDCLNDTIFWRKMNGKILSNKTTNKTDTSLRMTTSVFSAEKHLRILS